MTSPTPEPSRELEAGVLDEVASRIHVNTVPEYEPWDAMDEEDRDYWRGIARKVVEPLAAARSGHDGLLTALQALSVCSDKNCLGCQGIITRALAPDPTPVEPGGGA